MIFKKTLIALSISLFSFATQASFIDTDPYCTNYGCVVVSDHNTSYVFDVYNYTGTSTVPVGSQLNNYGQNPVVNAGDTTLAPIFTNTNSNIGTMATTNAQRLKVTNAVSGGTTTYSNGVLNAASTISKFGINSTTRLDYDNIGSTYNIGDSIQRHSLYISSRGVAFNIKANATLTGSGEFSTNNPASSIGVVLSVTPSGTDPVGAYGANTTSTYNFTTSSGLTLSNLLSNPTVAAFNGANIYATVNPGANIYTKSVRFNAVYTPQAFDLSQGSGSIQWAVLYTFWRK